MRKTKLNYSIEVFWSEKDKGYIALVPKLAGCSAWGVTEDDALLEVEDAVTAWIEAAKSINRIIPSPNSDGV